MTVIFQKLNPDKKNGNTVNNDLIAILETNINSDFWYHHGYYNGAEIIFENWYSKFNKQDDNISIDAVIYPVYYCYRQAIEVYIKKILRTQSGNNPATIHSIKELFEKMFANLNIDKQRSDVVEIINFINLIDAEDKSFTRFRYDLKHNGTSHDKLEVDLLGMVNGFRMTYVLLDEIWKDNFKNDEDFINNHYNRKINEKSPNP